MSSPVSRIWRLTAVTAGLWLAAALPAWFISGPKGIEGLSYASLLCLLPGVITLLFVKTGESVNQALAALLLGMGLRMTSVLGGALVLRQFRPDLGPKDFHVWLIVAYLVTLAVETRQLLAETALTSNTMGVGGRPAA